MTSFRITVLCMTFLLQMALIAFVEGGLKRIARAEEVKRPTRGCPLSPYATYLTKEQQETLHELVVEARQQGADEPLVKSYIDKYISKVLPPESAPEIVSHKYTAVRNGLIAVEAGTRNSRTLFGNSKLIVEGNEAHKAEKKVPKKVYDLIDQYSGNTNIDYSKFYEENVRNLRRF